MGSKRYSLGIVIRVITLICSIGILGSIFLREDLFFTQLILFSLIIAETAEFIRYANKTNLELSKFLAGIRDGDYQLNYEHREGSKSLKKLYGSFEEVISLLKELETERNAQNNFLNAIINQIGFGIIVFDEKGDITLMNQEASELLAIPRIKKWRNLKNANISFLETLLNIDQTQNQLIETAVNGQSQYLTVNVETMQLRENPLKICSFQNIKSEISQKETEAWQKLIRILTHETMNSVAPIVSLAETMTLILENEENQAKGKGEISDENISDIHDSVKTIAQRGEGMLKFVKEYRRLTRIPKPELEVLNIQQLLKSTMKLYENDIEAKSIQYTFRVTENDIQADPILIQQVIVNIVKNALEALITVENPTLKIESQLIDNKVLVDITNNGPAIQADKVDKIFVPFFTTKANGSGVGLSVSRQIMSMHQGELDLISNNQDDITFRLMFKSNHYGKLSS